MKMSKSLICVLFLAIILGCECQLDLIPDVTVDPNAPQPIPGLEGWAGCLLLKRYDLLNETNYGDFSIVVSGDEITAILIEFYFITGKISEQTDENSVTFTTAGDLSKLKEHENYKNLPKERNNRIPFLHSDKDGQYLTVCVNKKGGGEKDGFTWSLKDDKFVDKSACAYEFKEFDSFINDEKPGSTYKISHGNPDLPPAVFPIKYPAETFAASLQTKPPETKEELKKNANPAGFINTVPVNINLCFNEDATKVYSWAYFEDTKDTKDIKEIADKCANYDKKSQIVPEKHGGFIRGDNVYLFGADMIRKFNRTVLETTNRTKDKTESEEVDVTAIAYADFFQCPNAPGKSAGLGEGATIGIVIGVIAAIVVALLALYCVFGMKRKKERSTHKSNKSKKSPKSSSRKSARNLKTGSRKSLKGVKSSSRKSLKGVKSGSRKSLKKSGNGSRTGSRKSLKK